MGLLLGVATPLVGAGSSPARPAVYYPPVCKTATFHSEPRLYAQRACMNAGVITHGTRREAGSYLFLTPDNAGVGIYRDNGSLVWWAPLPPGATEEHDATVVRLGGRRLLAVWAGRSYRVGSNQVFIDTGSVLLYNSQYQRVGEITAGAPFAPDTVDLHEFRITPQGDALVGIYEPVRRVVDGRSVLVVEYVVQKLSLLRGPDGIHTGRVLFQWSTQGHIPLSASYLPYPGQGASWDFFHGNSIDQDSDGNLIVSGRNTWGIYKISVRTGRILWQVGGRGDSQLPGPWCYQHDVTALGHGEYALFDDGASGPGCLDNGTWHPSRGLIFRVTPNRRRAKLSLVRTYTHHPAIYSGYLGSIQPLGDGDVVVDWGVVPEITEYGADGRNVLMDLSLSHDSYRGSRYRWAGRPVAAPSVAGSIHGSGTDVWASWNGATEAIRWRVLGGTTPGKLRAVAAPVPRSGFETLIALGRVYPYVAVEALNSAGQALARSNTTPTIP